MTPDEIEIGKSYHMGPGRIDRRVIDIRHYPHGRPYVGEYREVESEFLGGKHPGRRVKESLEWFAEAARYEIKPEAANQQSRDSA